MLRQIKIFLNSLEPYNLKGYKDKSNKKVSVKSLKFLIRITISIVENYQKSSMELVLFNSFHSEYCRVYLLVFIFPHHLH